MTHGQRIDAMTELGTSPISRCAADEAGMRPTTDALGKGSTQEHPSFSLRSLRQALPRALA
jgi:hypothetical protein